MNPVADTSMQQYLNNLQRWAEEETQTLGSTGQTALGTFVVLNLLGSGFQLFHGHSGAPASLIPTLCIMTPITAVWLWRGMALPRWVRASLPTMRAEVRANLIDRRLLQLVLDDSAGERLPSLIGTPARRGLALLGMPVPHKPEDTSLRLRLNALVERYPAVCREAGLPSRSGLHAPWYAGFWNVVRDLQQCAVAEEIVEALTGAGDDSSR